LVERRGLVEVILIRGGVKRELTPGRKKGGKGEVGGRPRPSPSNSTNGELNEFHTGRERELVGKRKRYEVSGITPGHP